MVILVTGASSGIGNIIADHLSRKGHVVYGTSRSIQSANYNFTALKMDVTDKESVQKAVESIIEVQGRIDVVINNAGIGIAGAMEHIAEEDIRQVLDTNVIGVFNVCKAVIPAMRLQQYGRIINISSIGSEMGLPYRAPYSASKAAVDRLTEAMRVELKGFGIQLCSIQPGGVATDIDKNRLKTPTPSDSPYHESFQRAMEVISNSVNNGINPETIGVLVEKIMAAKTLKRTYRIGKPKEKLAIFIKRLLPANTFENILKKNYKI